MYIVRIYIVHIYMKTYLLSNDLIPEMIIVAYA